MPAPEWPPKKAGLEPSSGGCPAGMKVVPEFEHGYNGGPQALLSGTLIVAVARARAFGSATLVAVITTVAAIAGAVNSPFSEINPLDAVQSTAEFAVPKTVTENA